MARQMQSLPRCVAPFDAIPAPMVTNNPFLDFAAFIKALPSKLATKISVPSGTVQEFKLRCKCGSDRHRVGVYRWRNPDNQGEEDVSLSPVTLDCCDCGKTSLLFDAELHGYDAELGHGPSTVRGEGEPGLCQCASCGQQPMNVRINIKLPEDLFDGTFPEFKGREQDLFTYITVYGSCRACDTDQRLCEFDCA